MNTKIWSLSQKGFTLIELIITIVIIGVLAAVAIPKFQSLNRDAETGVASGVASSLASATSVNYARSNVPGAAQCSATVTTNCFYPLASCAAIEAVKGQLADIPTGYVVSGSATLNGANLGSAQQCTLTSPNGATVNYNAYGA
jgi:MSHA pilin protein MshA